MSRVQQQGDLVHRLFQSVYTLLHSLLLSRMICLRGHNSSRSFYGKDGDKAWSWCAACYKCHITPLLVRLSTESNIRRESSPEEGECRTQINVSSLEVVYQCPQSLLEVDHSLSFKIRWHRAMMAFDVTFILFELAATVTLSSGA